MTDKDCGHGKRTYSKAIASTVSTAILYPWVVRRFILLIGRVIKSSNPTSLAQVGYETWCIPRDISNRRKRRIPAICMHGDIEGMVHVGRQRIARYRDGKYFARRSIMILEIPILGFMIPYQVINSTPAIDCEGIPCNEANDEKTVAVVLRRKKRKPQGYNELLLQAAKSQLTSPSR